MATQTAALDTLPGLKIRRATPADVPESARICYEAFSAINKQHNFPPDFPAPEVPAGLLSFMFSHPGFYCVVAEFDGKVAGSNCLDERSPIAGIGPITIDPAVQNKQIGRALMQVVMDRAADRNFSGVRLVQAAFHNRSLSLYTKLGFDVREPLSCMQGPAISRRTPGYTIRRAEMSDVAACNALCSRVHGHDRGGELRDAIQEGSAIVAIREGEMNGAENVRRIVAYSSPMAFFGHSVAETNDDLQALIAAAPEFGGPGILVPTRNAALLRWCLENGLRITQPMTLMTMGLYNEPAGAYLPSILF
jgi:GNAT superfamily N-acetyltransferase